MPDVTSGSLANRDLLPTRPDERTWNMWHIASLWVGMSVCIPSYMLAASMVGAGLSWRLSLFAILLGNTIVLVPLVVNAHAGTRYGIPFPVFARASFGVRGAHVPSLLRAVVACGWFGIQTWIGGLAIHAFVGILWPGWLTLGGEWLMGYSAGHYLSFALFWLMNLYFVWAGTESIKRLETVAAPLLLLLGGALFWWAVEATGGIGPMLRGADALERSAGTPTSLRDLVPWTTAMVGYWATLSLNIPDFTRYARSQRDQIAGQTLGLLTAMPAIAFVGVAVTSATVVVYGEAIWNPVDLLGRLTVETGNWALGLVSLAAIVVATLTTNIAANIVAPANSFTNLAPRHISFRMGGLIAGLIGVVIVPWKLLDVYQTWLISYSGLLGAVAGVLIADYVVVRRGALDVDDLYRRDGRYTYRNGVNRAAMTALVVGILAALSGTLDARLRFLFDGAWFSAAGASFVVYIVLMRGRTPGASTEPATRGNA